MRRNDLISLVFALVLVPGACDSDDGGSEATDASQDVERDVVGDTSEDPEPDLPGDTVTTDTHEPDGPTGDTALDRQPDEGGTDTPCTLCGSECGADERCVPLGANEALVCRPRGPVPVGQPCGDDGIDDCVAGAVCVAYDDASSFCRSLCVPGDEECGCPSDIQLCVPWFGTDGAAAGICLGSDCTPPSTGCGAEQRCTVLLDQVLECVPVGSVAPYGDCSVDECQAGSICRGIDGALLCRPFCRNASDCAGDDTHCVWPWPELTDWGFCRPGCDPVLGTGCSETEGCYFMDPEVGETDCWTSGTLPEGADCSSFVELCEPGLDCVLEPASDPFEYYCRAYCDDEHPCDAPQECTQTEALGALKICL